MAAPNPEPAEVTPAAAAPLNTDEVQAAPAPDAAAVAANGDALAPAPAATAAVALAVQMPTTTPVYTNFELGGMLAEKATMARGLSLYRRKRCCWTLRPMRTSSSSRSK